jgi:hypothetical protein
VGGDAEGVTEFETEFSFNAGDLWLNPEVKQ